MGGQNRNKYTMVAGKAIDFATMFNHAFSDGLKGPVHFKVELTEPGGPSTGGGKQVIQHVRLLPPDGGAAIVIGSTNPVVMSADIRTFRHIADNHARRYRGVTLPIDPVAYNQLTALLTNFFGSQGMKVTLSDIADSLSNPPPALPSAGSEASSKNWLWGLLVVVIVAITAAAVMLLRHVV